MKIKFFISLTVWAISVQSGRSQYTSLLWEVHGNGIKNKSYLYGTIHIKDKRVFELKPSVKRAFKKCKAFAGEVILSSDSMMMMAEYMLMPPGKQLSDMMSKEDYEKVLEKINEKFKELSFIANMIKPIYLGILLGYEEFPESMPYSLDEQLQIEAESNKKKIFGLESIREQLETLNSMPMEDQIKTLIELVNNDDEKNQMFDSLVQIYLSQNLDSLYSFVIQSEYLSKEFNLVLLKNRNIKMTERIEAIIKKHGTFIAVGAAHLPGEYGLIDLLRSKGYVVKPVY